MRTLFVCVLILFCDAVSAQVDSLRMVCLQQKVDSVSTQDLMWMYRQRDTLRNHGPSGHIQLIVNGAQVSVSDSTNLRYLRSLESDFPALDDIWAPVLSLEIQLFQAQKDSLLTQIKNLGWSMRYLQAIRNLKRQQQLNLTGRSQVLLSFHNFNLAVDVGLYHRNRYLKRSPRYQRMGEIAKQLGMYWGGDFVGFPDAGHVQRFKNSAVLVSKYPEIAFEFEKYRDHYTAVYVKNSKRLELVQDTGALLIALNRLKVGKVCACQNAIIPRLNQSIADVAHIEANTEQNWVFLKPYQGDGYFYSLGRWAYSPKK